MSTLRESRESANFAKPLTVPQGAEAVDSHEVEVWHEDARRFASAFTFAAIGMALVSPEGRFLQVNRALCQLTGYTQDELMDLDFQSLTHADDLQSDLASATKLLKGEIESYQTEKRYLHKDGYCIWILLSVSLIADSKGQPLYFISQMQDISDRKRLESERQAQSEAIRALVENAPDIIARVDKSCRVLYVNAAIEPMTGHHPSEFLGRTLNEVGLPDSFIQGFEANVREVLHTRQSVLRDYPGSDGVRHFHGRFVPEFNVEGEIASVLIISRDISDGHRVQRELKAAKQKLKLVNAELWQSNERLLELANHDELTGLKNRRYFDERLREAIERAQRVAAVGQAAEFSLLLLDIDHFKQINDSWGHAVGDEVLQKIAQILMQRLRQSDFVARYGGEEFAILLFDTGESGSIQAAESCRSAVQSWSWQYSPVTLSVGVATWSGEDSQTLLVRADLALYAAKGAGRNCIRHAGMRPPEENIK